MSTLAYRDGAGETITSADELAKDAKDAIKQGREARKGMEATWHSNLAFAAGKFWLKWNRQQRRLQEDPRMQGIELYTTDVITEYRTTALGELGSDDDRPELLLIRDDQPSEDFQEQLNKALGWGWDHEWKGDAALAEVRRLCIDLGTSAIRCRFDPTVGPVIAEDIPHQDGLPVLDPAQAMAAVVQAAATGRTLDFRAIQQGRITWEPLSPFNLIVPPGIPYEHDFPWECVVRPVLLSHVKAEYGDVAATLKEDTDIASVLGLDVNSESAIDRTNWGSDAKATRVHGHVWLFTYYERSTPRYPRGRKIIFGTNKMVVLKIEDRLPYERPDGSFCSGIAYFHWWRVTGRFWSRSLVEAMKDPQRSINKRRTQINEIIDRGLPAIIVEENSKAKERKGYANEFIEIGPQERQPVAFNGISPGEWMYHDIQEMRGDVEHATGIRGPRLGENPVNVTTYSQLALLNENDQLKRMPILREHKQAIAELVEASVYDIRTYWGHERQIALAGDENTVDAYLFDATKVPTFFIVKVGRGAVKPRSQAAELTKVADIWGAALNSQAVMTDPYAWVRWFKDSLEQGMALDLPEGGMDEHEDKAELENSRLLSGEVPPVQYYDQHEVHIPRHRELQMQAEESQDLELWQRCEDHVQLHVLTAQRTAQLMAQMAPPELPPEEMSPDGGDDLSQP